MRVVFACVLLLCSLTSYADEHARLYQAGGWPEQRAHFSDALTGLDYAGLEIWKRTEDFYFTKRIGLSPDVSIALGWLFN